MATTADFRVQFPEFSSTVDYPDGRVDFWLNISLDRVDKSRWGDSYDGGVYLILAHSLSMWKKASQQGSAGGVPNGDGGAVSSKSIGDVSVSYDTASASWAGKGSYNQTNYGRTFLELARLYGAGATLVA